MRSTEYNYPLIAFKEGDKNIYASKSNFGIVPKGGDKFYKNLTVIDSAGKIYRLKSSRVKGAAPLMISLKFFQKMLEMELEFEELGVITLAELKAKIMDHVAKNSKHWLVLDTTEGIQEKIEAAPTFKDLILIFQ